ncbi:FAD-dependent pyridine nucleotide-disulphide oxidoreductase [Paraburkholderia graminis C4D1M]|uniref:Dihydrolipoyl dehydrogenase n=1 Tax=Paraburkholderia graminis (strain ATCC 700544 / DSM 17151 / LMG 18924 / NCIMB 13744 / C4D1M) TaxID=396598 RepID=B1GBG4_PARG4|nr:FAD-dependent pyridine nucleotide-disulphide oxidoreductase [Paraburkholderia graminis C4D1M]
MSKEFDVVVIGAGPGGYIAAIRAAQLGKTVACIEKWKNPAGALKLGGTCLNVGCIPSKALLASSEEFENASHHLADHGISVENVKVDISKMMARKDGIVDKMTKGIEFLFRKNKITWLKGHGKFTGKTDAGVQIEVSGEGETEVVTAKNVIIATGSKARHLPNIPGRHKIVADTKRARFRHRSEEARVIGAADQAVSGWNSARSGVVWARK